MGRIFKNGIEYGLPSENFRVGTADKAVCDENWNCIDTTYFLKKDLQSKIDLETFDENTSSECQNAGFHNSIFRGKDITSKYLDGSLYTSISNGTFDDLYIGDYFIANINGNNVRCRIAGFDMYYNKKYSYYYKVTSHHAVIVPDEPLMTAPMNDTITTSGGYANSKMHTTTIPIIDGYLRDTFGDHLMAFFDYIESAVGNTGLTSVLYHDTSYTSGADIMTIATMTSCLMTEIEVFGNVMASAVPFTNSGYGNIQFPLYKLEPSFIFSNTDYWLKSIADITSTGIKFNFVSEPYGGTRCWHNATTELGVRPKWFIK